MHTHLLYLIVLFIVYLLPQAMVINGIFLASRGSTEKLPGGFEIDGEMIFYPLRKYLEQSEDIRYYYLGKEYYDLLDKIYLQYSFLKFSMDQELSDDLLFAWKKHQSLIEQNFSVKTQISRDNIMFYKEYPEYRFSKYVRKPLFGCIICMASFWGLFTFLLPALFAFHFDPIIYALYFPNTACLGYLNYKIMKPL